MKEDLNNFELLVFTIQGDAGCRLLDKEVLACWKPRFGVVLNPGSEVMTALSLPRPLIDTPISLFTYNKVECGRYSGFKQGDRFDYLKWIAGFILPRSAFNIAYGQETEPRFSSPLLEEHSAGLYTDPITGSPLFLSEWRYDSGSGWPSFVDGVDGALSFHEDNSLGMHRVEIRSASSGIHLGHLFDDGPPPKGKRFCINGEVLVFQPNQ